MQSKFLILMAAVLLWSIIMAGLMAWASVRLQRRAQQAKDRQEARKEQLRAEIRLRKAAEQNSKI